MIRDLIKAVPGAVWLKRRLFGTTGAIRHVPLTRASERGPQPEKRGLNPPPGFPAKPTFALYRIIGNDLVPRHRKGQARENLPFILEQEPELTACEKRFVVNRIVDPAEEDAIIEILEKAGAGYLHIPFDVTDYANQPWDIPGIPSEYAPGSARYLKLRPEQQSRIIARLNRHKNNYVVHNNGARNAALSQGRELADWVLPWDGNCFLSESAWEEIRSSLTLQPDIPAWLIPMARLTDNTQLSLVDFRPNAREEPQIILRADCPITFNPDFYYGRRPKVELFWRLGVPGKWDDWGIEPWDLPCPAFDEIAGAWGETGWVARLSSGRAVLEQGECRETTDRSRAKARAEATQGLLDQLDTRLLVPRLDKHRPVLTTDEPRTNHQQLLDPSALIEKLDRTKALPQQCIRAFLLALAGNFQDFAKSLDPTRAQQFKDQACTLILNLTENSWDNEPRKHSAAWRWIRHRRPNLPQPELLYLIDTVDFLAAEGNLLDKDLQTITAWLRNRYKLLGLVAPHVLADPNLTQHTGAFYLEASRLEIFLRQPLRLRNSIRDAQVHFRTLFLEDQGAAGTALLAKHPATAIHWLQLIELAKELFEPSNLTHLSSPALADTLTRAINQTGTDPKASALLQSARLYAYGSDAHRPSLDAQDPWKWIYLDRHLRFHMCQTMAQEKSDNPTEQDT